MYKCSKNTTSANLYVELFHSTAWRHCKCIESRRMYKTTTTHTHPHQPRWKMDTFAVSRPSVLTVHRNNAPSPTCLFCKVRSVSCVDSRFEDCHGVTPHCGVARSVDSWVNPMRLVFKARQFVCLSCVHQGHSTQCQFLTLQAATMVKMQKSTQHTTRSGQEQEQRQPRLRPQSICLLYTSPSPRDRG